MNHLQVIYSLLQMGEAGEAESYLEEIHGRMKARSLSARTQSAAVNALLQAKAGLCHERGVAFSLTVSTGLGRLPLPEWEFCRILGNLMDNAVDALQNQKKKELRVEIGEDIKGYIFTVANSGPKIPEKTFSRLFTAGFTTKKKGQGLGLHIVKTLAEGCGGSIAVETDEEWTVFTGFLPLEQPNIDKTKENEVY